MATSSHQWRTVLAVTLPPRPVLTPSFVKCAAHRRCQLVSCKTYLQKPLHRACRVSNHCRMHMTGRGATTGEDRLVYLKHEVFFEGLRVRPARGGRGFASYSRAAL